MSDQGKNYRDVLATWETALEVVTCDACHWTYLASNQAASGKCPHCHKSNLSSLDGRLADTPRPFPPEQVIPFDLTNQVLANSIHQFAKGIPYAPEDLNPHGLQSRLSPVYLPLWLVDAQIHATWQAEAGFDYEVISHQETYNQDLSGWETREVKETRVRWENRVGRIGRDYQNVTSPALDEAAQLKKTLGDFTLEKAQPYHPGYLEKAFVRLPDHSPEEAWPDVSASFQNVAMHECMKACGADHLRQFRWKAQFDGLNWTLMLLPAYTSYYLDDHGIPQPVLIHGQTGNIIGKRQASIRRAWNTSLIILLVGLILFLSGLIMETFSQAYGFLAGLSTFMILAGILTAIATFVPYLTAWDFNRKHSSDA